MIGGAGAAAATTTNSNDRFEMNRQIQCELGLCSVTPVHGIKIKKKKPRNINIKSSITGKRMNERKTQLNK